MPSEILGIDDTYIAYCFNEACAYIQKSLEDGKQIIFKTHHRSFSDFYKTIERGDIVTGKQIGRASCRERVSSPV